MPLLNLHHNQGKGEPVGRTYVSAYYVDATNGDDNNEGKSPNKPWQTIIKVNAQTFYPGDRILFKRNEEWVSGFNQLTPGNSGSSLRPIVYGAYGSGDKPIINEDDNTNNASYFSGVNYLRIETLDLKFPLGVLSTHCRRLRQMRVLASDS